jgi:hypothetical protein
LLLNGCGVADVAMTGAAGAASEIQQAKDAKATEDKVRADIDAAQAAAAQQRDAALKEAGQ